MGWQRRQYDKGNKKKGSNRRITQKEPIPFPIPIQKGQDEKPQKAAG